jgi:hypothetical protein
VALVAGRKRVPRPAAGTTAFLTLWPAEAWGRVMEGMLYHGNEKVLNSR